MSPGVAVGVARAAGCRAGNPFTTNPYNSGEKETLYDVYGIQQIQQAIDLGTDVESHNIGHFPDFDGASLTLGSKTESAANYLPQYSSDLGLTIGISDNQLPFNSANYSQYLDEGTGKPLPSSGKLRD